MTQVLVLRVEPLAPLLFRDARPFGASADETRARSLLLPGPSTIAGLVRTFVGEQLGWDWGDPTSVEQAKAIRILGYHFVREDAGQTSVVLPAPATAVVHHKGPDDPTLEVMRLSPADMPAGQGCDLPDGLVPLAVTRDVKPVPGYGLWLWSECERWLAGETIVPALMEPPPIDERVNIAVDPATSTAAEGMLFVTEYRAWEAGDNTAERPHVSWALVVGIDGPELDATRAVAHFGGERRPVAITVGAPAVPAPGPELMAALTTSTRLTMHLATPALFDHGWRPGWLSDPGALHPALTGATLVAAAVGRHETVAGWNHDLRQRGPKATRWAAPAGSTYFLHVPHPLTEQQVGELWMRSVSDATTDQDDGYGSAVWGVWNQ